jgi:hypothetical protein
VRSLIGNKTKQPKHTPFPPKIKSKNVKNLQKSKEEKTSFLSGIFFKLLMIASLSDTFLLKTLKIC